jgi:GNAT superfamily N-acetyltransferase
MGKIIQITPENIDAEHICCAISDKKCRDGYELKKDWLKKEYDNGYIFRRLDARAKVFIEYGPSEFGWSPINAENYTMINCFWVSGKYKRNGYGKTLLNMAIEDAISQKKEGLVTVVGTKKFHFMSDTKWLLSQGFEICETLPYGFSLLVKKLKETSFLPSFKNSVLTGKCNNDEGIVVYYSNRCPFTEYYVQTSLRETCIKRNITLEINKLQSFEQAQSAPTPATIFSLFYNGNFITTDVSICLDSRFDKLLVNNG